MKIEIPFKLMPLAENQVIDPGHKVQFLDKPNGANGNGAYAATDPAPAQADDLGPEEVPF